jgi:hypothetical protein
MKKLLLSLALLPVASFAQITLDNTHFPGSGDQLIMSTLVDQTVDYLSTGANYTWDFSALVPTGQRFTNCRPVSESSQISQILFGTFAPTAYKASYFSPTTDLPLDELTANFPVTIDDISLFSKNTASALTMVGYEFVISGQGIPTRSDTIETRYPFPLNYGDSYTSRGYTDLDLNPIYDAKWRQHRYRESAVDGWGTITTPYGTYQALRIHHRILESDSLYLSFDTSGMWLPIVIPEAHEYEWRAVEEKEAVFRVKTSVILGNEQITEIEYRDDYNGLGIAENQLGLTIYPNPANDALFISCASGIRSVRILDQRGQIVQTIAGSVTGSVTASLSALHSGMYYAVVESETGTQTILFVKQ